MRIAVPVVDGQLTRHFGHCQECMLFGADPDAGGVADMVTLRGPPHQPGLPPQWPKEHGVDVVIAGGMGRRAQMLFAESGVQVLVGAQATDPQETVAEYLSDTLQTGADLRDH